MLLFKHKLLALLLPCALTSFSSLSFSIHSTDSPPPLVPQDNSSHKEFLIGTGDKFLKLNGQEKQINEILKEYASTTTGAKVLADKLSQHVLLSFIDNYQTGNTSHIGDKLKSKVSNLRSTHKVQNLSGDEKKEALWLFGGKEEHYQQHQVLGNVKNVFLEVLNELLQEINLDDKDSKFKEGDVDKYKDFLSKFLNHALDDYIKNERPVPIKKLTWKYDTNKRIDEIKELINPEHIPAGSKLPETPNYFFPLVSTESNKKFKDFLIKIKDLKDLKDLQQYSDTTNVNPIVTITNIPHSDYTSQYSIALLDLYHYLIKKITKEKADDDHDVLRDTNTNNNECKNIDKFIPNFDIESKDLKDLFCLKKESNNFGTVNEVSDFVYLISKQQEQQSWIIFKDKEGIHAITYDWEIFKKAFDDKELKKLLFKREDFKIKEKLFSYITKHIGALLLGYWDKFFNNGNNGLKYKDSAKTLSQLLFKSHYSPYQLDLRKKLTSDFLDIFEKELVRSGNNFRKGLNLAFAGKFPKKFFEKTSKDSFFDDQYSTTRTTEKIFPYLEDSYLLRLDKKSRFMWAIDSFANVEEAMNGYKKNIEDLFKQQQQQQQNEKYENQNFFYFGSEVNTLQQGLNIEDNKLFSSLLATLLKDNKIVNVFQKEKVLSEATFLDNQWKWKESGAIIDHETTKDLFKNETKELPKELIKNYLISSYLEKLSSLKLTRLVGKIGDDGDFSDSDKLFKFLEKVDKEAQIFLSSKGFDFLSEENTFLDLLTAKWLSENKFENLRKHLNSSLSKSSLSAFVFSRKYSEVNKCLPSSVNNPSENLKWNKESLKHSWFDGNSNGQQEIINCPFNSENLSFAKVVVKDKVETFTGYKGLISGDWKIHFPEEIVKRIESKSPLWKDSNALVDYIDESIKEDKHLKELIDTLKTVFPNIAWEVFLKDVYEIPNFKLDWNRASLGSRLKKKTTLDDRKEALKHYLKKGKGSTLNMHMSLSQIKAINGGGSPLDSAFESNSNEWLQDEYGNYLITDKEGVQHLIFLVPIKHGNVKDVNSWTAYLKTITSDLILREVVKLAKDHKIQKKALFDKLANKKLDSMESGDYRLRSLLGYQWLAKN
ncbi:hypothetical protein A6V39_05645 [Candidatus Mycoplasma haematobovis]|uniref:Uncharacterized protein n=1 Tax=Candidatus Mycoplasma haematobovis TaxID=432608 RepID=A0A1A9QFN5_9MOLU|nr:DUF3713 domain-containing protein [Candidatus Mycoplasma haematobovis]OAL10821.1 hypothetical protein A6V39_05645 [Candidatus Mycoplasma haematobovis]